MIASKKKRYWDIKTYKMMLPRYAPTMTIMIDNYPSNFPHAEICAAHLRLVVASSSHRLLATLTVFLYKKIVSIFYSFLINVEKNK